ncbi:MAG: sigma-54 dependent transcriptional regulator [Desulfobacula sp.]|jgi:two-component system response regulator AtoC|nr:sigma-54 dependent transcriptional regulator [Desulfobacula sp.]
MANRRILVADDEHNVRRLLKEILTAEGYHVTLVENGKLAIEHMAATGVDLLFMDIRMPVMDGLTAIKIISKQYPDVPVIMMTAFAGVDTAVEAMKLGAYNYISKPFNNSEIRLSVKKAMEIKELNEEVQLLRKEVKNRFCINNIIGKSEKMQTVFKMIGKISQTNATVLIQGETGTGKELVAKAIHYNSQYNTGKFVGINCASIPEGLIESEFFGHEKGAFTCAVANKIGKFEYADNGTLFLDEIGEMMPHFQANLLKVIQDKQFQRLGGLETITTNVRIIAATNRDLEELLKNGGFREDLYYRLNVIQINIPPLRERKEDIALLVEYFLNKYAKVDGIPRKFIAPKAMNLLCEYNWTGNVRELENQIERAVVMARGPLIMPEDLSLTPPPPDLLPSVDRGPGQSLKEILREVEKSIIVRALDENRWNRIKTASALQMSRKALFYKIDAYGLAPKDG